MSTTSMSKKDIIEASKHITAGIEANMKRHIKSAFTDYAREANDSSTQGMIQMNSMMDVMKTLQATVQSLQEEVAAMRSGDKPAKKVRKKKDPDAPKKKPSGYIMYGAHVREVLGEQGMDKVKIAAIANIWRSETNTEAWNEYAKADGEGDAPETIDIVDAYTTFIARSAIDTDGDGKISADEISAAAQKKPAKAKKPADPIDLIGKAGSEFHKVGDIREELERRGLVTTGKKAEIVERLKEAMRQDTTSDEDDEDDTDGYSDIEDGEGKCDDE